MPDLAGARRLLGTLVVMAQAIARRVQVECPKCRTTIVWPADLSITQKGEIAEAARADRLGAVQLIRLRYLTDLRQAKALALHITSSGSKCHKCSAGVGTGELNCPKCRSLNLNW